MMRTRRIEIAPGMTFDVSVDGIDAAPLVLMLHGFGVSRFFWNSQVHALGDAGYFAVAPNQRGYAAGARPDPTDYASYRVDRLIGDALDIVTAVGHGGRRFHLVGHDWGASLAWQIADQHPERLVSLTILSRPHPLALLVRWHYRTATNVGGQGTIRHSWNRMLVRTYWRTMRTGCGRV
jgi:pimeloyl-ACP methyl ester carboxylesterase